MRNINTQKIRSNRIGTDLIQNTHNFQFELLHVPSNSVNWAVKWCFLDWATAVVGEADQELTCVTLIYHSSGPIYETSAESTKSPGTYLCL